MTFHKSTIIFHVQDSVSKFMSHNNFAKDIIFNLTIYVNAAIMFHVFIVSCNIFKRSIVDFNF